MSDITAAISLLTVLKTHVIRISTELSAIFTADIKARYQALMGRFEATDSDAYLYDQTYI